MNLLVHFDLLTLLNMGFFDPCSHGGGGRLWFPLHISETIHAISMKLDKVVYQSIFNNLVKNIDKNMSND